MGGYLTGIRKKFSFIEKMFSKIYSHFQISAIFGEFGVNFWDLCMKSVGMLFNLILYTRMTTIVVMNIGTVNYE